MENEEIVTSLNTAINDKHAKAIKEIFETVPAIDIAEVLEEHEVKDILYVFRVIGSEYSAEIFTEFSIEKQEDVINSFTDKELIEMLENSFTDDIVDALEELPANLVSRILKVAPKELRKDINTLLNYEEDTAGSLMTTEYLDMRNTMTVKDVIKDVRTRGRDAETVYTIFIRDDKRNMVGTVDLDDLIFAEDDKTMEDIMNRDFVTCSVKDDQEAVANMFKRYDLNAMAVLNKENKIVGIITIDDVVDIIVEEANEDIANLNNVTPIEDEYLKTPIHKIVLKCIPWIIALMVLQVFSTLILSKFEAAIATFSILSVFTPLIMDAGGNSGGQTTTLIVRSIALDEFQRGDTKKVLWKEFRVAAIIAAIVAIFAFCWLLFEMAVGIVGVTEVQKQWPALTKEQIMFAVSGLVACTLFITIVISRLVGCMLPFLAKLLKRDPAVMCGPLTTTVVDIVALLTYFLLWTFVFGKFLGVC